MSRETWERRAEKFRRLVAVSSWWPFFSAAPPGHFYSPIPDLREVERDSGRLFGEARPPLVGIDIRPGAQVETLRSMSKLVTVDEFAENKTEGRRYYWRNPQYGLTDAYVLTGMLRLLKPKRVIEVGSGFSSAVMLDTTDAHLTFIEPFPARLQALLRPGDRCELLEQRVQDVPLSVFARLEAGDLLFIDSSHVVKTGGDVVYLVTEVLPRLKPGVVVHVHDIFYPFELPEAWVRSGYAWAENYLLKAFLQFNDSFEVVLFVDWLHKQGVFDPRLAGGGSIYLHKTR